MKGTGGDMQGNAGLKKTEKKRWKQAWPLYLFAALAFAAVCVVLISAQMRSGGDEDTRFGFGRLAANYEIAYKPGSLYEDGKAGDKEARLLAYIDHVTWKLDYQLDGFDDIPADYEYSLDARLVARYSESNKYMDQDYVIWQKRYPLIPSTKVSSGETGNHIEKKVDVNLDQFREFIDSVFETSQVHTTNELELAFRVKAVVHGPAGDTVDDNTLQLVVPMLDGLFLVTGEPVKEDSLGMKVSPAGQPAKYTAWAVICGLVSLLALALAVCSVPVRKAHDEQSRFSRTVSKIFKQYGERLVRLENPLPYQQLATISIDGMAEIVKIADEISQPVFYYKVDTPGERKVEFYVFDTGRIYYMVLFGVMDGTAAR